MKHNDLQFISIICNQEPPTGIFKKNNFIYFFGFIYFGCAGSSLLCGFSPSCSEQGLLSGCAVRASHGCDFSCCGAQALGKRPSVVVACGLQSTGSVVVANGLSCPESCGVFLDQGLNLCLLYWRADSLPLSHQGSPDQQILEDLNLFKTRLLHSQTRLYPNSFLPSRCPPEKTCHWGL